LSFTMKRLNQAQRAVLGIFFVHGFVAATIIPRIPELINQIGVEFSTWGLIMGVSGLGGLLGLTFTTRLIARYGTKNISLVGAVGLSLTILSFAFIHNAAVFFIAQSLNAFLASIYIISINSQTVALQKAMSRVIIGKFHAAWSLGTALSSALSGYFSTFLPLSIHLVVVPALSILAFVIYSKSLLTNAEDGHGQGKSARKPVSFLKSPAQVWLLAAGLFTGVMCEVTMMDWSAVFSEKALGLGLGRAAIPFIAFSTAMIIGRMLINKASKRWHLSAIARVAGITGSLAILAAMVIGVPLSQTDENAGLVFVASCFTIAGFGAAPMVPSFFSVAGSVKGLNTAQVLARMSLVNSVAILITKILMGATAQSAGVVATYFFGIVAMFIAGILAGVVAKNAKQKEHESPYPATGAMILVEE
jgi:predicted MFS family arabinose efflux permease